MMVLIGENGSRSKKESSMNVGEFRDAIEKGLGRAILFLQDHPSDENKLTGYLYIDIRKIYTLNLVNQ